MTTVFASTSRRAFAGAVASILAAGEAIAQERPPRDPLPSWRDGLAKRAIFNAIRRSVPTARTTTSAPPTASPSSTMTAHCGSSIPSTRNSPSPSTG